MKLRYYHMKDPSYHEISAIAEVAWKTGQVKSYGEWGRITPHDSGRATPPAWQRLNAITVCEITCTDGEVRSNDANSQRIVTGYAFCSARDNFCRAKGRKIALGRAARQLGMSVASVEAKASADKYLSRAQAKLPEGASVPEIYAEAALDALADKILREEGKAKDK